MFFVEHPIHETIISNRPWINKLIDLNDKKNLSVRMTGE
jgi:hypothetical protein